MITPEIKNYIQQARASGMADDQIRQALVVQGWAAPDLDEAFGIAPATAVGGTTKSSTRMVVIIIVIIILIPLVGLASLAGYGYYRYKKSGINISTSGINNPVSSNASSDSSRLPGNSSSGTASGSTNMDRNYDCTSPQVYSLSSAATLPEGWPTDLPVYPGAVLIASSRIGTSSNGHYSTATYCTKDTVDAAVNFFTHASTPWVYENTISQNSSGQSGSSQVAFLAGSKTGTEDAIRISITAKNGNTTIGIIYLTNK
jgi:hypothetical protein